MTEKEAIELAEALNKAKNPESAWFHVAVLRPQGGSTVMAKKAIAEPKRAILESGGNALQLPLQEVKEVKP